MCSLIRVNTYAAQVLTSIRDGTEGIGNETADISLSRSTDTTANDDDDHVSRRMVRLKPLEDPAKPTSTVRMRKSIVLKTY